jgi:hypothetical protein
MAGEGGLRERRPGGKSGPPGREAALSRSRSAQGPTTPVPAPAGTSTLTSAAGCGS